MEHGVEETEGEMEAGNGYYWMDHSSTFRVAAETLVHGLSEIGR